MRLDEIMEKSIVVRKAEEKDLLPLLSVLQQLKPKNKDYPVGDLEKLKGILRDINNDKNYYLKVCEVDGKIAGTATLLVQMDLAHGGKPYGHIENVVTDQAYRGKGIGQLLVENLITEAKNSGCYKVILDCSRDITGFYSKMGFEERGSVEMRLNLV